jgi:GTPase SAR1 family protein
MRYAVFVTGKLPVPLPDADLETCILKPAPFVGPAGAGKSTFCNALITHAQTLKRTIHYVNLDPAATNFEFEPSVDIKDLIDLQDVMDELEFGPNGGLVYCFE